MSDEALASSARLGKESAIARPLASLTRRAIILRCLFWEMLSNYSLNTYQFENGTFIQVICEIS
jgi:hypothetical protein